MKYFFLTFLLIPLFSISQTGYIQFNNSTYDFNNGYINDSYLSILSFNQYESLDTSFKYGFDEDNGTKIRGMDNQFAISESLYDEKGQLIYRNFETKEFVIRHKSRSQFEPFIIKDHWLTIEWDIKEEYKSVLNYKVQKAVGFYRGRNYTVWFAKELPYPYGPWKIFGLSGFILEYSDGGENYGIAKEICYPCDLKEEIAIPFEHNVRTIEEHARITDNLHIFHILEFRKRGVDDIVVTSNFNEVELLERRHKSREYLFEWEDKNTKRGVYDKKILKQAYEYGPSVRKKLQKLKEEKEKSDSDFNIRKFRN